MLRINPLEGDDNLHDAVSYLIKIVFAQQKKHHPRSSPLIWVWVNVEGEAAKAIWATSTPQYGSWFSVDSNRLIQLHGWLMRNCFVALGDRVWQQVSGIPMGFSCSPLWCNMYLLYYETQFVQRLAKLGRTDLMAKFKHAYRYIDDLWWVNIGSLQEFLTPEQSRVPENPYWIYPLEVLEIKCEIKKFDPNQPFRGIHAHFMNLDIQLLQPEQALSEYTLYKYDKRRELPFSYTQYIMF